MRNTKNKTRKTNTRGNAMDTIKYFIKENWGKLTLLIGGSVIVYHVFLFAFNAMAIVHKAS